MGEAAVQDPVTHDAPASAPSTEIDRPLTRTQAMEWSSGPRNFDEAWRMADILAKSSMVPKIYQGKPADVLVAMQYGNEVGLPPMASLQSVAVINGKPGLYGDGFLGVIQSKPAYAKHVEYYELADGTRAKSLRVADYNSDDTKAVSIFWRKGNPEPFEASFSIGDAKRAKLWGKDGPWSQYPARQLMWRARGYAGRDGFAAELRGIKTVEELRDFPDDPIVTVDTVPDPGAPPAPLRRSEKAEPSVPPASAAVSDAAPEPTSDRDGAVPKPAGAGKTAKAAAEKPAGPGKVTRNVAVMETVYVGKPTAGEQPYHEVQGVVHENGKPGPGFTWRTRDEQLVKLAESCAGTNRLFTVTWHELPAAEDKRTKAVKVITGLSAAD